MFFTLSDNSCSVIWFHNLCTTTGSYLWPLCSAHALRHFQASSAQLAILPPPHLWSNLLIWWTKVRIRALHASPAAGNSASFLSFWFIQFHLIPILFQIKNEKWDDLNSVFDWMYYFIPLWPSWFTEHLILRMDLSTEENQQQQLNYSAWLIPNISEICTELCKDIFYYARACGTRGIDWLVWWWWCFFVGR